MGRKGGAVAFSVQGATDEQVEECDSSERDANGVTGPSASTYEGGCELRRNQGPD